MNKIKLLAISGSLRKASYNTAAIKALQILAPSEINITIGSIDDLPLFNPDREDECIPALEALNTQLRNCGGLIISSPEYAHGISGPMKNALDWLVAGVDFPYKPIMLINTSPRATHAQASLREILKTMSGDIIEEACVSIPLLSSGFGVDEIVKDEAISERLMTGLKAFCNKIGS